MQKLLDLRNVKKKFGRQTVLKGVDLVLESGEMLALLGHNGAGKTTLMKILLGLLKPDEGQVKVLDGQPGQHNRKIGYIPENVSFYQALTGIETLKYFARLNGIGRRHTMQVCEQLLDRVHLEEARSRPVKTYSKGMIQRLGLAQALLPFSDINGQLQEPALLILDEPTVGLDPIATEEFYLLLTELQDLGCGIVICTHVLPGLDQYLDQAMIMYMGEVIASGSIDALRERIDLPVTIRPKGLNGSLTEDPVLSPYLQHNALPISFRKTGGAGGHQQPDLKTAQYAGIRLKVPASHKLAVINRLVNKKGIEDIQVESASLPDLYQFYVQQAENQGTSQVSPVTATASVSKGSQHRGDHQSRAGVNS